MAVGDLDGDGNLDLAVINSATDVVSVLLNHGDGTFVAPGVDYPTGDSAQALAIADLAVASVDPPAPDDVA